jgi:arsenate reductase
VKFKGSVTLCALPVPQRNASKEAGMEIWINPDCSKCRSALQLLESENAEYTVRRYLEDPPNEIELREVLTKLRLEPWDITRFGEATAADLGIADWPRDPASRSRWIKALASHPILIQRPIITAGDRTAVVARTPEAVRSVLSPSPSSSS